MVDVLCIGHASWDISVFVPAFPAENSKGQTDQLLEAGGGPAANAAYLLSSWGIPCAFAGLLGDDFNGRRIRAEFESVGTDLSFLETRPARATPVSVIVVNLKNGSRTLVNCRAKDATLHFNAETASKLSPRVMLFDGHELPASLAALEAFPKAASILDAGSLHGGTSVLANKVSYLVASERFALQSSGLEKLDTIEEQSRCLRQLRKDRQGTTVVTLGERGSIADDGSGLFHLPAFESKVLDTTAAGDIFHGAFAYAVVQSLPLREALRLASMAASLSVQTRGGRPSIPTLKQVREALAHVGPEVLRNQSH